MPRDRRIWMTFPINFWLHPKIRPLSDAAFRAFVEINGYSRMEDLDGRVPVVLAKTMWKPKALGELLANHPERPSLSVDGDVYVIWNYSEHQDTVADREARTATNTANGKRGGRPRKTGSVTDSVSGRVATEKQSQSQESESEDLTDITHLPQSSPDPTVRAFGPDEFNEIVIQKAQRAGIQNLGKLYALLADTVNGYLSAAGAVELVEVIVGRSQQPVKNVDRYVASACANSPDDIQWHYDRLDLGVA